MELPGILTLIAVECCILFCGLTAVTADDCNTTCKYSPDHRYANCKKMNLNSIPTANECSSAFYLDVRWNSLRYLDGSSFSGYSSLRYLYLEYNSIGTIAPGTFAACTELDQIFLQNNQIVNIVNDTFFGMSNLRHLYLNFAGVDIVEAGAFSGLSSIERLYLKNNNLRILPRTVFQNRRTLEILMLSNNKLESLYPDQFDGLVQLMHVEIQNNRITRLQSGLFRGLPRLRSLNVSSNSISEIHNGAVDFVSLPQLEQIDLSFNDIIDVRNMSDVLADIPKVFFAGNPMRCDCINLVLMKWYEKHSNSTILTDQGSEVICNSPGGRSGVHMKEVSKEVISFCKDNSKLTVAPYDGRGQVDSAESASVDAVKSDHDMLTAGEEAASKNQTAVARESSSGSNANEESKLYMYIGIGALTVCVIVIIVFATVIIRKFGGSRRQRANTQEKDTKDPSLPSSPPTRIVENPLPEESESSEEDLYEPIASMQEFPPPRRGRIRKISETDSAFSEGSFPEHAESEDFGPPVHPPPPPPPHSNQLVSGYIQFYSGENGKVYLCTQCPHSVINDNTHPILVHSVSVPAHCSDLANGGSLHSQRQPLLLRQHSFPEQRHRAATYTCANQPDTQVSIPLDGELPSYAQATKHQRSSVEDMRTQNQQSLRQVPRNDYENCHQNHDGPPSPMQTDKSDYSQIDLSSYPSTNPFSIQSQRHDDTNTDTSCSSNNNSSNRTSGSQPRKVSFSKVNAVYTPKNPDCGGNAPVYMKHQLTYQHKPVCT